MYEIELDRVKEYAKRLEDLSRALNIERQTSEIEQLEGQMSAPGFWNDQEAAQHVVKQLKVRKAQVELPHSLRGEIEDARDLIDLAQLEQDASMEEEMQELLNGIESKLSKLELSSLFSDPRDAKPAIVSIHPGAGGTESCDWAEMLYRMILRFCERNDFEVEIMEYQPGDEAGIKSITMTIDGVNAYGHLKSEDGVHRLVRISPFDSAKRRHTSFAAIEVLTPVDTDIEIDLKEEEIKMDVYRSSAPGGQKVNKTSSAVRLTHLPTGIVVACQVERSQHRNREMAMNLLKAKLYDIELNKQQQEIAAQRDGQQDVAWGSQIRSYVLHPYQMVKDLRSGVETGNVERVLDGEIDLFIESFLKWNLERKGRS